MSKEVQVRGLRKSYQGHQAVGGTDLDIGGGEILALPGPNGAGKTTTVEILAGQRGRDAGTVQVLGEDPANAGRGRQGRSRRSSLSRHRRPGRSASPARPRPMAGACPACWC
jgi:ABC-type multidrug transport system ATPase subunit